MSRSQRYLIFAAAILVTGVISGLAGASTTLLLRAIEHLIYGYTQGPMLVGVRHASIGRRVIGPAFGTAVTRLPLPSETPETGRASPRRQLASV